MKKGKYVDGFVLSVPKNNTIKYKKLASEAKEIWMKFGALDYKECMIDDIKPKFVSFIFPKMAKPSRMKMSGFHLLYIKTRNIAILLIRKLWLILRKSMARIIYRCHLT